MQRSKSTPIRRSIETASGRISYAEQGAGPVAFFVHGVLLNGHLWRHQLEHLSDIRRCIAVDLLAHGETEIAPGQDVSVTANAKMLKEFLDALNIEQVDLIGNDSGGVFRRYSPPCIRSGFAASHLPIATHTTTGLPRPSSRFWRWLLEVVCAERSRRCCPTRVSIARRKL